MSVPTPAELQQDLDTLWVVIAAGLVLFMQAGFLLLEVGFSRAKNAGAAVAKIFVNLSVASVVWWAVGFGIAFGGGDWLLGHSGFFYDVGRRYSGLAGDPATGTATGHSAAFFMFQFAFAAISLAIVWGTTLERIKFIAYPLFGVVFCAIIYPLVSCV